VPGLRLVAVALPWWAWAIAWTIASPRPVPPRGLGDDRVGAGVIGITFYPGVQWFCESGGGSYLV
jgi:hypothetical protein